MREEYHAESLLAQFVHHNYFSLLGIEAQLGRVFQPQVPEQGVVILSHRFWQNRFGGREDILGTTVTLENEPFTIIGVMHPSASAIDQRADIWLILDQDSLGDAVVMLLGRLKQGVSPIRVRVPS